jgi:hypothetical protein
MGRLGEPNNELHSDGKHIFEGGVIGPLPSPYSKVLEAYVICIKRPAKLLCKLLIYRQGKSVSDFIRPH